MEYTLAFLLLRYGIYMRQKLSATTFKLKRMAVINKIFRIRRVVVIVIILLHALITINFAATWPLTSSAFVRNGKSFWTVYLRLDSVTQVVSWLMGITASMSTILADIYMIWCCWMIWGRRSLVILLPILSLISATGEVSALIYCDTFRGGGVPDWDRKSVFLNSKLYSVHMSNIRRSV
ncbi:hypothetical protein ARMSODRAFT_317952 [Armillaria solidipes]|uniref:Uncharacterized protein n=1 Tax=Armillaria solidipes TaxID=1076256 RepID=A0A2H3BX22_9AGAR|nr:hypothetical protein ARMSODRAFT_317952 [Armillaria solidipes]